MKKIRLPRLILACILLTGWTLPAGAQAGALSGRLLDEKGAPLPFANVTLLKAADTSFAAGTLTDSTGHFTLAVPHPGRYFIRFTAIGFAEGKTDLFDAGEGFSRNFGTVTLKLEAKAIDAVTVTALRPTIVQLPDRMVVGVEGTAMAAGRSAFDVLARAPGVFVDPEGNIQLNGRSGVTVMLDGKLTYLSARDLRNLLEGMSAENIRNIEIITNPSAKYDAEGTSGILNINLKKNVMQGMNGAVYAGYTFNGKQHGYTAGGNINYRIGKWNSFLFLDAARRVGGREATFTRVFYNPQKTTYFDQVATGNYTVEGPPSARFGTDYTINDRHSIGFMGNFSTNKGKTDFLTDTYIGAAPKQPVQFINADNYGRSRYSSYTANLHYQGKLDSAGTTISTDLDYVKIESRRESNFYNYFTDLADEQITQDFLYNFIPSGYDIYSAKADFTRPFSKGRKMEAGVKMSRVISDNDSRFYFNNNGLALDPLRTNYFHYEENIYAAYLNYSGSLSKKLTFQSGLRAEQTAARDHNYTTGQRASRNYLNLFPSVFLQQKVNENYGINWSYSRRLQRPNYGFLNPFRFYRDPYTWEQGNPGLRPQYTHAFSITQVFKKTYNLVLTYNRHKDVMAELPILNTDSATTIYTTGNVDRGNYMSLSAVAPYRITKWWDSQNTLQLYYNKLDIMVDNQELTNDRVTYYAQSNHTVQLPAKVRMEVTFWYRGKSASGLYLIDPMWRADVAFRKSVLKKKLDLTVNANDLFKSFRYRFVTDINGNINEFDQYFRWRSIGFSLRYNFSRGLKVEERRRSSVEEVNRT